MTHVLNHVITLLRLLMERFAERHHNDNVSLLYLREIRKQLIIARNWSKQKEVRLAELEKHAFDDTLDSRSPLYRKVTKTTFTLYDSYGVTDHYQIHTLADVLLMMKNYYASDPGRFGNAFIELESGLRIYARHLKFQDDYSEINPTVGDSDD